MDTENYGRWIKQKLIPNFPTNFVAMIDVRITVDKQIILHNENWNDRLVN